MLSELEVACSAHDAAARLQQALYDGKAEGRLELEVPFARIGLPAVGKFSRHAVVTLGETHLRHDGATIVPIVWRDARSDMFPEFKGSVEILPLAHDRCQIAILGAYVPPMGPLGAVFDAAVGKHIAEVTVQELLVHLRAALEGHA